MTEKRPADIVSPITDIALPDKVSLADARSAARVGHDKPTSENSIVLLIDHQIGLMAGVSLSIKAMSSAWPAWRKPSRCLS